MAEKTVTSEVVKSFGIAQGKVATEHELLNFVMDAWRDGIERRRPFEKDWMHNIMFAAGHQWLEWDVFEGHWLLRDRVPKDRIRMVENRTRRLLEAAIALMVGHRPCWNVISATRDQKDRVKAEMAGRLLDACWEVYGLDELTETIVDWQLTCGIVGVKTIWDDDLGPRVPIQEVGPDGQGLVDENGEPILRLGKDGEPVLEPAGDVRDIIVPPFMFLPDPSATVPRELRWVIHHPWRPADYIRERWPKQAELVHLAARPQDEWTDTVLRDYYSSRGMLRQEAPEGKTWSQGAYIAEMIIRPGRRYPKGAMIHVAISSKTAGDGVFLDFIDELDRDIQEAACLPSETGVGIEFARCFAVPGRFWPIGMVDLVAPLNKHLNRVLSDILEIERYHARPKWLVPRNAALAEGALHQGTEEVVEYAWPFRPEQSSPPQMPMYVIDHIKSNPVRMQEIAGVHQATLGQTPGDMRSGVAISLVQEQDERGFTRPNREKERLLGRMGRRRLALMRDNMDDGRLVHLAGSESSAWDMAEFKAADLNSFREVVVKEGSTLRRNVAAQRAHIMELLQSGAAPALTQLPPIEQGVVLSRILEALGLGEIGVLYDNTALDAQNARFENAQMERGRPMPLTVEENPLVHLRVHGDDLKAAVTQAADPGIIALKRQHYEMTRQLAAMRLLGTAPPAPEDEKERKAGPGPQGPATRGENPAA